MMTLYKKTSQVWFEIASANFTNDGDRWKEKNEEVDSWLWSGRSFSSNGGLHNMALLKGRRIRDRNDGRVKQCERNQKKWRASDVLTSARACRYSMIWYIYFSRFFPTQYKDTGRSIRTSQFLLLLLVTRDWDVSTHLGSLLHRLGPLSRPGPLRGLRPKCICILNAKTFPHQMAAERERLWHKVKDVIWFSLVMLH